MDNHIASKAIFIGKFVFTGGSLCQLSTVKNTFWFSTNTFGIETNTYVNVFVTTVCQKYFSF